MQAVILTVLLLVMSPPSWAAIAELPSQRIKATECANCDTLAVAYPGNVTAGNLLVVGGNTYDTAGTTGHTVTDSVGTSYTVFNCSPLTATLPNATPFIAVGIAPSSGANTVTVNPTIDTSANQINFGVGEFSGTASSSIVDVDGGSSTGTSTSPSDGITTVTANALIIGLVGFQTSAAVTPSGSYTEIVEDQGSINGYNLAYRLATTATAYTADWTLGSSQQWTACTVAIKPLAGAPATRRRAMPMVFP